MQNRAAARGIEADVPPNARSAKAALERIARRRYEVAAARPNTNYFSHHKNKKNEANI
jgi:hypothetical protein